MVLSINVTEPTSKPFATPFTVPVADISSPVPQLLIERPMYVHPQSHNWEIAVTELVSSQVDFSWEVLETYLWNVRFLDVNC